MSFIPSQLIVVSDIFEFQDGTLHFAPAVPISTADRVCLRAGDQLELRRPDGSVIKTTLHGIDRFSPSNGSDCQSQHQSHPYRNPLRISNLSGIASHVLSRMFCPMWNFRR